MKHIAICVSALVLMASESIANFSESKNVLKQHKKTDDLQTADSSISPFYEKKQEKRYVGGYGSGLDYYNPYSRGLGYDYGSFYNPGSGSFIGPGAYGGYGASYGSGYGGYGYNSPLYNSRIGSMWPYPYSRTSFGYNGYPSSYFGGTYGSSIIGGGLGGLGSTGYIPPIPTSSYQYGPGISGTIY